MKLLLLNLTQKHLPRTYLLFIFLWVLLSTRKEKNPLQMQLCFPYF